MKRIEFAERKGTVTLIHHDFDALELGTVVSEPGHGIQVPVVIHITKNRDFCRTPLRRRKSRGEYSGCLSRVFKSRAGIAQKPGPSVFAKIIAS